MILRDLFRPYPERKSGIVNLKSGTSFRGVMWKIVDGFLVLRNTEMLQDMGTAARHMVDGEVLVDMNNIDFIQVVS